MKDDKKDNSKPANNSLAHTKWNCKYHIVFAPKFRRMMFFRENKEEIGSILRELCSWKGVTIIQAEVCPSISICWWRYRRR